MVLSASVPLLTKESPSAVNDTSGSTVSSGRPGDILKPSGNLSVYSGGSFPVPLVVRITAIDQQTSVLTTLDRPSLICTSMRLHLSPGAFI